MKSKLLNSFLSILIISILSLIISFLINNYNLLFISNVDRGVIDITNKISSYNGFNKEDNKYIAFGENENIISIDYQGFINKLIINYHSNINFNININYVGTDDYDKFINKNIDDMLSYRLNKSVVVLDDEVNYIELNLNDSNVLTIDSIKVDNSVKFNFYLFLFIFISLVSLLILYKYYKKDLFNGKIECLFLVISLLFGTLMIILQPKTTSYSWDDQIHFTESYRIFEFDGLTEWSEGISVMSEVDQFENVNTIEERKLQNEFLNNSNKIVKVENNSPLITYNQVGYLLPGFILKLSSILNINFTTSFSIAKFVILLSYSFMMYLAIKTIPRGKRILSFIGLFPSVLFLATQFSYDPPIIAGIALFVSVLLDIIENKRKVDLFTSLLLLIPLIIACFIKAIYIPLILLILFIPKDRFDNYKQNVIFKIGSTLICVLLVFTFVFPTLTLPSSLGDLRGGNTSTSGQLSTIINNPFGYIEVLKNTAGVEFIDKLLGPDTIYNYSYIEVFNNNLYYLILIGLVFIIITDSYNKNENKFLKVFTLLLILGIILLIWTALYLSFTPVGETVINGVQNRYFIPLLFPLILICFSNCKIKNNYSLKKYDMVIFSLINFVYIYSIYETFILVFCK